MNSIIISEPDIEKLNKHLLQNPNQENMAVLFCGYSWFKDELKLLVKDVWLIKDSDLEIHSMTGLEFKEEMYRKILLKCEATKTSVIISHSHPFAENAWFSCIDNINDTEHAKFLKEHLPNSHYGNMVVAQKDFKARIFNKEKEIFEDVQEIKIFGRPQTASCTAENKPELNRNYRAFGKKGQAVISESNVAIIGLGGLGWQIAPMLVGIGVKNLLLVDYDIIEFTNLNRLPFAPFSEIDKPKVKILSKLLRKMNPYVNVLYEVASVFDNRVIKQLKEYDILIGALDSERARSYLNNFAVRYFKYYLDAGSGILQENKKVKHADGQVNVIVPGISPCLACNHTLDWKMILYEGMDKKEQDIEVERSYIQGVSEPAPAVVSINSNMAAALVNEFMALTTGLKKPNYYTYFDFMNDKNMMFSVDVKKNDNCIICSKEALLGYGDVLKKSKKPDKLPSFIIEGKL